MWWSRGSTSPLVRRRVSRRCGTTCSNGRACAGSRCCASGCSWRWRATSPGRCGGSTPARANRCWRGRAWRPRWRGRATRPRSTRRRPSWRRCGTAPRPTRPWPKPCPLTGSWTRSTPRPPARGRWCASNGPVDAPVADRGSAPAAVGPGDDLEEVAVVAEEVDAAAPVVVVDLARPAPAGVGPVVDRPLEDALVDGGELVFGDEERVVLGGDVVGGDGREVEADPVRRGDLPEVTERLRRPPPQQGGGTKRPGPGG